MARDSVTLPPTQAAASSSAASPLRVITGLVAAATVVGAGILWAGSGPSGIDERAQPVPGARGAASQTPDAAAGRTAATTPMDPASAGAAAYTSGNYDEALAQFHAAIAKNPDDAESHSNLGQVLVRLQRPAEALPHFDRAIGLNGSRWAYHFNRARALGLLERWDEAIGSYTAAQRLFPGDYATAFNLAQAYHRKGDEEAAVGAYLRAIELDPADPTFRLALGISYERLQRGSEAAAAYAEYLRLSPDAEDADKVRAKITQLTPAKSCRPRRNCAADPNHAPQIQQRGSRHHSHPATNPSKSARITIRAIGRAACRMPGMLSRGFTLIEVLVALGLLCVGALGALHVVSVAMNAMKVARLQSHATALAAARLEQLRSLTFAFDDTGARVTDAATDLAGSQPRAGGAGLAPSPPGALDTSTPGFVDYLDHAGQWVGTGGSAPAGAVYVRRWSLDSAGLNADHLVVQVYVAPLANVGGVASLAVPGSARLTTLLARTHQ